MEQVKKFFEALANDPAGRQLLGAGDPGILVGKAGELGFALTAEEIAQGLRTLRAEDAVKGLDIDDLDKVAGGASCPTNLRRKYESNVLIGDDDDSSGSCSPGFRRKIDS